MEHYVIYDHPSDFPASFVVRKFTIDENAAIIPSEATTFDTLENARASIPPGLVRIPRDERDDPVIIETWI